jgi:phosphate transport system substrate-binding protein
MKSIVKLFKYLPILCLVIQPSNLFSQAKNSKLSGKVVVDGSSTVFPISEAVGEEFQKANAEVKVAVAVSGTGGGFKKFCKGEVDITGASRAIESKEIDLCKGGNISYVELPVAYDGITIVVNKKNTWIDSITTAELKKIWNSESKIKNWREIRAEFPDLPLKLFGPGHDSGTFDYFTKAINGVEKVSRSDFTASEDDNMLVKGVQGEDGALGYFGFAYYESNKKNLKALAVDAGSGSVLPSVESIRADKYIPLSRPLYIYVSLKALSRLEVSSFAQFYMAHAKDLAAEVGYISLPNKLSVTAKENLDHHILSIAKAKK